MLFRLSPENSTFSPMPLTGYMHMVFAYYVIVITVLIRTTSSSVGDSSSYYRSCTDNCRDAHSCPQRFDSCSWTSGSCFRCRYECMWKTVDLFMEHRGFAPQFHGKWPFVAVELPFLGMFDIVIQEPASFVFSLMNFYSLWLFYQQVKLIDQLESREAWRIYTFTGLVTWICSALFHARDCWVTEYLDYFSAFAFILSASYVSFCFTQSWFIGITSRSRLSTLYGSFLLLWFTRHVYHMTQHFDYGYNMRCCIGVSLLTTAMYLLYITFRWKRFSRLSRSDRMLIGLIIWTNGSVLLETLDFAPIFWIFDPHSLFHAATMPLPLYLSVFLREYVSENRYRLDKDV
ncbi:hypothetical protein RB195_013874 [Necator americanus]|uniref:Post-GPI attachment to proteins factor 3 n=1 Tax=Necator americanus TaxID=51031 RepID=A0ABR1DXR9_NECAM